MEASSRAADAGLESNAVGELIGSGKVADVHACGERAVKLYRAGRPKADAFTEAAMLALVETHRLPAPRAYAVGTFDGRWGLVMDRIAGPTLAGFALDDASRLAACLSELVRLQLLLHAVAEPRLRPLKGRLAANIARAPMLAPAEKDRLRAVLAGLPDGEHICHGDLHPYNILGEPGRTTIIDWMDVTAGPPAADACRTYLLLSGGAPALAAPYLAAYEAASRIPRAAILAWLPVTAAARLCEDVPAEQERLLELARGG